MSEKKDVEWLFRQSHARWMSWVEECTERFGPDVTEEIRVAALRRRGLDSNGLPPSSPQSSHVEDASVPFDTAQR